MLFRRKQVSPEYYLKRGVECFGKGDFQWALQSFSIAIEFFPDFGMAYYMRAEVYKKLGMPRESVWDCIKFLERGGSSDMESDSFGLLDAAKFGLGIAGIDVSDFTDVVETVKEKAGIARFETKRIKAQQEIVAFGIPRLLEELIEGYSPERTYDDTRFYFLALRWLEKNNPESGYYIGFVQLLLKNFDEAIRGFDAAITHEHEKPNAYYFRGISFIKKMEKTENMETSRALPGANSDFAQALKNDSKWRICPRCGYRTDSKLNYCMLCGMKLLVG